MIEVPFLGQAYKSDVLDVSPQVTKNLFPEIYEDKNAKVVMALKATPGLLLKAAQSYGENRIRSLYLTSTGRLFSVRGRGVAEFDTSYNETSRFLLTTGSVEPTATIVRMADNGVQMLVVDGSSSGFTYNLNTDVATVISDTDFPGGSFCAILDGFYLVNKPNTTLVLYSSVDDPTTWSSLSTLSKEGTSDFVTGLIASNRRLWVFGNQSYEVFYNTGVSNNQFLRMEGTYHEIGLQAPDSLTQDGQSVFFLGANSTGFGQVFRSVQGGFDVVPISTKPLEAEIHGYSVTNDAEGYCYQQEGNQFYQLTFPSENKTWVYDTSSGMWHERCYRNPISGKDESHRSRVQAFFDGKNIVGDRQNGNIYEISTTTYTDNGDTIIRERISPVVWNALERVFYKSFQLDVQTGVGLSTGQGSNPKMWLSWSNDAGHVYQDAILMDVGDIGAYLYRVKRERLGNSRHRVFRITYSEPTAFAMMGAYVEFG